ncbi:MAG: hypothetical protein TR69_WS6001000101 [candidate division WS6 bacterium OLB20]|uniref:Calcineurin-like phosphoesterase domain-containing protein n=1 Tax=candidate division WS6 bacterium OLB20 TaxID=1617426 RepID=A0A136M019_9BACT|nr:MAG: hypothetical protein TR69_WS6001000101 [candidate division WS6 bacterium OLB20]
MSNSGEHIRYRHESVRQEESSDTEGRFTAVAEQLLELEPAGHLKTPDVINPPFRRQAWIKVDTMPQAVLFADTHLMPAISSQDPRSRMSSTKRYAFNFSAVPGVASLTRWNDLATRVGLHLARKQMEEALTTADIMGSLGDNFDAYGVEGFLETMAYTEDYVTRRFANADRDDRPGYFSIVAGNHDMATRVNCPEAVAGYMGLRKQQLAKTTFDAMVALAEKGYSMHTLHTMWKEAAEGDRTEPYKLLPAERWFLQRLYTGPEIGAFEKRNNDGSATVVAFLNSEFGREGCTLQDLCETVEMDLGREADDETGRKMIETYASDIGRQRAVIDGLMETLVSHADSRAVVYTHNPVMMQQELIRELIAHDGERFATFEEAREFVTKRILTIGGHYHLKEHLPSDAEGIYMVNGFSRQVVSMIAEGPRRSWYGTRFRLRAYSDPDDYAEFLFGALDDPQTARITGAEITGKLDAVRRDLKSRLLGKAARAVARMWQAADYQQREGQSELELDPQSSGLD